VGAPVAGCLSKFDIPIEVDQYHLGWVILANYHIAGASGIAKATGAGRDDVRQVTRCWRGHSYARVTTEASVLHLDRAPVRGGNDEVAAAPITVAALPV
jgi:hypothetical protein